MLKQIAHARRMAELIVVIHPSARLLFYVKPPATRLNAEEMEATKLYINFSGCFVKSATPYEK